MEPTVSESQTNPDQLIDILRSTIISLVRREGADLTARQLGVFLTCYTRRPNLRLLESRSGAWYVLDFARSRHSNPARTPVAHSGARYYMTDEAQTVRGLAADLNISKPAITRALDRLSDADYLRRKVDPRDRRSVLVRRTTRGAALLRDIKKILAAAESGAVAAGSPRGKRRD
jgi:DNA-binding MarR family transcriptional regulator